MEKRINFGGVGASIGTLFIYAIIFTIAFIFGVWDWFDGGDLGGWNWIGITIALFFSVAIYFFPTLVARDVSSRIEEIEAIRERDGLYKNVRISHPFFWVIFLVNIFFGYTGIVWLIIFLWAHAPGEVTIPNSIAAKLKPEKQADLLPKPAPAPTKSLTKATTPAPSLTPATDLESKLQYADALSELRNQETRIRNSPSLNPQEKSELLLQIKTSRNDILDEIPDLKVF